MNPTMQRLARDRDRPEEKQEANPPLAAAPDTLAKLERRVATLERQLSGLELRLADAFARERAALRAEIDRPRPAPAAAQAKRPVSKKPG